jgi:hypothetical protein
MNTNSTIVLGILLMVYFFVFCFTGCKNSGPLTPYDLPFTPTPTITLTPVPTGTPTPIVQLTGSVNVAVQDKNIAVSGLLIQAIPPSGVTVFSQATTTTGIASFTPPYLEVGTWSFVVPAQTSFPYAPSTITMPVSVANETANFNTAGATVYLTPTVPEAFTSANPGSPYTYNLIYSQPGNLFVPAQVAFSGFPTNWSGSYGPAIIGYGNADTASITVIGVNCVDKQPSFAVTMVDAQSYPRAYSTSQTIQKSFTSTVTVSWNTTGLNAEFCNNGTGIGVVYGTLTVSTSNACSYDSVVSVSLNVGNCCYSQFQTPNGNVSGANCGGGAVNFGAGSYNCTIYSGATWGSLTCSCNGTSNTVNVPTSSGSTQLLNVTY